MNRDPATQLKLNLSMALFALLVGTVNADGWSTYRAENTRSGYTGEEPRLPLALRWVHDPASPPDPAWPAPARGSYWQELEHIAPRLIDDLTFHPVVANGAIYYGSSSDDSVACLDAQSGDVRWTRTTDGPIRYAPVVADGRVYFASDDGNIYCAAAVDGELLWKHRVADTDLRIPGNGRIISAWPARTGLIVADHVVYGTAGLYPTQGVFACALHADQGEVIWKRKINFSPQGYLLASESNIYVPTGRGNPVALDRSTGDQVQSFDGIGGTFALISDDTLIAGPGNDGSLSASDVSSRNRLVRFQGRHMVVTPRHSFLLGRGTLTALDRVEYMQHTRQHRQLVRRRNEIQAQIKKAGEKSQRAGELRPQLGDLAQQLKVTEQKQAACRRWKVNVAPAESMIVAGSKVFVGGDGSVEVFDVASGQQVWEEKVDGRVLGMAFHGGMLVASTDRGSLHGFGRGDRPRPSQEERPSASADRPQQPRNVGPDSENTNERERADRNRVVEQIVDAKGFCLALGAQTHRLAVDIARRTDLRVIIVDRHAKAIDELRTSLVQEGLYGTAVTAHHVPGDRLPFTNYFANVIVTEILVNEAAEISWQKPEILRVLRPYGGLAWLERDRKPYRRNALPGAGDWSHLFANTANTASTQDRHVHRHLRLQWFGGPGPKRMVDRHLRAPAPLVAGGRMFVPGENVMIAVDAYNGTELWQLDLPKSQRYSMPYDAGYMSIEGDTLCIAVRGHCWVIDAGTGQVMKRIAVPWAVTKLSEEKYWGYTALVDGRLYGSAQHASASRTVPSRQRIDDDYENNVPIVTGQGLFCVDAESGGSIWQRQKGVIVNSSITIAEQRIFFFECRSQEAKDHDSGRIDLRLLTADDTFLVCLDSVTGQTLWEQAVDFRAYGNSLFLAHSDHLLVAAGSQTREDTDQWYHVRVYDARTGQESWRAEHPKGRPGETSHGEQVHHPVIVQDKVIVEPAIYELQTGRRFDPDGIGRDWRIERAGHGCGTISAAGNCLFFRAGNPTLLDLSPDLAEQGRRFNLSPSRPGCLINIIPAAGLVLIPEASASCVCHYSLQTSMAFLPVSPLALAKQDRSTEARHDK